MKKYMVIPIALLLLVTSCTIVSDLMPKALAAETQDTVVEVKTDSASVYAEIQANINLTLELKNKVQQAQLAGTPMTIDQIISDVTKITESYEKLSGQHQAITQSILQKIKTINDMEQQVNEAITDLQTRKTDYQNQLLNLHDPNPEIVKSRTTALQQAIKYTDSQILLWQNFLAIENEIAGQMNTINNSINSFLSVIDSSALVYREGLNLLTLQKNFNDALSLFNQDLPEITSLTAQMENAWSNLDFLVTSLTNTSSIEIPR